MSDITVPQDLPCVVSCRETICFLSKNRKTFYTRHMEGFFVEHDPAHNIIYTVPALKVTAFEASPDGLWFRNIDPFILVLNYDNVASVQVLTPELGEVFERRSSK